MKIFIRCIFILCFFFLGSEVWGFTCNVSTTSVAFGNYDVLSATPTDSTGNVHISCTFGFLELTTANVVASIGPGYNNNINPRTMHLVDLLNYYLCTDTARTTVWGNGTSSTVTQSRTLTTPNWLFGGTSSTDLTIYGRIPASQNVSAGAYTDALTVTINY